MGKKLRVAILFGGRSGEHEVSLLSAASILKAIDRRRFEVVPVGITKEGEWLTGAQAEALLKGQPIDPGAAQIDGLTCLKSQQIDVVFPVLHGTFGEDGTMQGLLELAGVAYVGSGVLGSSAGMDKDLMKRLFAQAKLPIAKYVTLLRSEFEKTPRKVVKQIETALKYPVFVKPANLGSSVGISKAHDRKELIPALELAAKFDRKIVVEQGVGGAKSRPHEFEVAVLGNDDPQASVVGEIIPGKEFYDYEDKYLVEGSVPVIPAKITKAESKQIREMAVAAFKACDLAGLARVDFLMDAEPKRRIYINEVNTLPGFTRISMYPKLWDATGTGYKDLISKLIDLALERHSERVRNCYSLN